MATSDHDATWLEDALVRVIRMRARDAVPQEVDPGLFIGSVAAARNRAALLENGITHIVCAAAEAKLYFPSELAYLHLHDLRDATGVDIERYFDETFDFIDGAIKRRGRVLVHCVMGRSRSSTIVAAYMMRTHGMAMLDTLGLIRQVRPSIAPNRSFSIQLLRHERRLRNDGTIARAPAADRGDVNRGAAGGRARVAGWLLLFVAMLPVVLVAVFVLPSIAYAPPFPGIGRVRAALAEGTLLNQATWPYLTTTLALAGAGAALTIGVSRAAQPNRNPIAPNAAPTSQ